MADLQTAGSGPPPHLPLVLRSSNPTILFAPPICSGKTVVKNSSLVLGLRKVSHLPWFFIL
ncbi:hypothetical protein J6590_090869 [Homalodisca vitripennis]|nr:hypothetical protein J6590_090869 [Homalodisca vitripennis]